MVFEGEVAKIVKAFGIILCFGFFLFRYPQIWSLTDFPSSNIVTYLWQQLHIQLVSRDVTYHSEKIPECKDEPKLKKKKTTRRAYTLLYGLDYLSLTQKYNSIVGTCPL